MIGVIYEGNVRHELAPEVALALRALGIGYQHIRPVHAALLATYSLCFRGRDGYELTKEGRDALTAWDGGNDYDPREKNRVGPDAPRDAAGPA
jgi:hypothetical protein